MYSRIGVCFTQKKKYILDDLIGCYVTPQMGESDNEEEEVVIDAIHEFFKHNDIIGAINRYQRIPSNCFQIRKTLGKIVYKLDTDTKYEVMKPAEFMKLHINRPDFGEFYKKYEKNFVGDSSVHGWDEVMLLCLRCGYYENYKFLLGQGFKISRIDNSYDFEAIVSSPEVLESVQHLFPINNLLKTIAKFIGSSYSPIKHPGNIVRLIEYNSKFEPLDFNELISEIQLAEKQKYCAYGKLVLTAMFYGKTGIDHAPSKLKIYSKYDVDMLFRETNVSKVETWKFNFTSMLRFHQNI